MNFIEVRSGGQVLILARPGVLPSASRKASDRQRLPGVLARLPQDKPGMAMLRAGWSAIFPTGNIAYLTDTQIATQLSEALRARRIEAVLLRDPSVPLTPAELQDMQHAFANATMRRGQIIIGGRGTLPPAATGAINPSLVVQMLGIMQDGEESAVTLDRQASRLSAFGLGSLRGPALRQGIVAKINQRVLDAAYIPPGPAATAAANHSSAGVPVDKMSMADKVGAALERSLPHLSGEIRALVAEMVTPTNLVIMAAVFVAVALANTNPVTGAAVDTILIGLAWFTAGLAGIRALGDFIDATIDAVRAQTQAELDAAGQTYARALVGLGSALIQAIMARFLSRRGGETKDPAGAPANEPRPAPRNSGDAPPPPETPPATPPKALSAAELAAQRRATATEFYRKTGWSEERIADHVAGIDYSKPVDVITINPNTNLVQWQIPGRPMGNYFAPEGVAPNTLGIDPAGRVATVFKTTKPIEVLRSTAADIPDWNGSGLIFKGGGTQYFSPDKGGF